MAGEAKQPVPGAQVNIVCLQGTLARLYIGAGKRGKYAFGAVQVDEKSKIEFACWDAGAAADLEDAGQGAEVALRGSLSNRKQEKWTDDRGKAPWVVQVVVTKATLVASAEETRGRAAEDLADGPTPF